MNGGFRPGAGRPRKGDQNPEMRVSAMQKEAEAEVSEILKKYELNPLEYMLQVMNDPSVDPQRKDRMAVAAAPYVHTKKTDAPLGKKEAADELAKQNHQGTGWGDLLPSNVQ